MTGRKLLEPNSRLRNHPTRSRIRPPCRGSESLPKIANEGLERRVVRASAKPEQFPNNGSSLIDEPAEHQTLEQVVFGLLEGQQRAVSRVDAERAKRKNAQVFPPRRRERRM